MMRIFALDITDIENWKKDNEINERNAYEALFNLAIGRYNQQTQKYGVEMMQTASRPRSLIDPSSR